MISLNGRDLTIEQVIRVTRGYEEVKIAEEAKAPMDKARAYVEEKVASGAAIYGLTTGFGKFQDKYISIHDTATLQRNLIVSHACGMGEPFAEDITRGIMLLRCNALCRGNSGIRRSTVETLIAMLNAHVHPIIPQKGSLGASGDLAPLAHMVLVMIGEGEAVYNGERMSRRGSNGAGGHTHGGACGEGGPCAYKRHAGYDKHGTAYALRRDAACKNRRYCRRNDRGGTAWHNQGV